MKKLIAIFLTALVVISTAPINTPAESYRKIFVNNQEVKIALYADSNYIEVPIEFLTKYLGCKVSWGVEGLQRLVARRGDTIIKLDMNSNIIYINGKLQKMAAKCIVTLDRNSIPCVPVDDVCKALGCQVEQKSQDYYITVKPLDSPTKPIPPITVNPKLTKYYNGISFNPQRDVFFDGRMKPDKAAEFYKLALKSLKFYKLSGKYYVKFTGPTLPPGFNSYIDIVVQSKDSLDSYSTNCHYKSGLIPQKGSFCRRLYNFKGPYNLDYSTFTYSIQSATYKELNSDNVINWIAIGYDGTKNKDNNWVSIVANPDAYAGEEPPSTNVNFSLRKIYAW
jgi:hypothetical protein